MHRFNLALAFSATLLFAGCGGNGDDTVRFKSLVSFGDSLSDVGTYSVGGVKSLGGGKYTVNAPDSRNWIEIMASRLQVSAPCAAQTGLDGNATLGFSVPVTNFNNCTAYAQGGARVTEPVGPGNKSLGGVNALIGQLTVPVVTQIQNHLARNGGSFKGDEIVFIMAGGNDVFTQLATVREGGDANAAVTAVGAAGAELAGYVKNLVLARGAKYVTVVNLPDINKTPFGLAQNASTQGLTNTMVAAFNSQLQQGLSGSAVLYVDAYTVSRDQSANPAAYGLTNTTRPACDLSLEKNPLGSSLVCTKENLISGTVDRFQFADSVHLTPYGYELLARLVSEEMTRKGWL